MSGLVRVTGDQYARATATRQRTGYHTGIASAVRAVLAAGPLSREQIFEALAHRFTRDQLRRCVDAQVFDAKIFLVRGTGMVTLDAPESKPLAVREFKPLKRDPFEMWRLCERDPFETTTSAVFSSQGCA